MARFGIWAYHLNGLLPILKSLNLDRQNSSYRANSSKYFQNEGNVARTLQNQILTLALSPPSCNDLLQLIHGRTLLPHAYPPTSDTEPRLTHSYLPGQLSTLIDLDPLQEDILSLCVVGVPLIDPSSIDSLRLPFKFKEDTTSNTLQQLK